MYTVTLSFAGNEESKEIALGAIVKHFGYLPSQKKFKRAFEARDYARACEVITSAAAGVPIFCAIVEKTGKK